MQSKRVLESASLLRDNPDYPGVPQSPEVITRATVRATVDYDTYTLRYASRVCWYVLLATFGIVVVVGVGFYLRPPLAILVGAFGIGLLFGGAAGVTAVVDAHKSYTRDLAHSISETYERPQQQQPSPATVRPFVPSGTDHRTTNTGRLDFRPEVWRDLFDRALARGGVITRDEVAKPAGVGRRWYHAEGWGQFLGELTRLGFIDDRNRLTPTALAWYAEQIPLPLATIPTRSRIERTNGERTANERGRGVGE